MTTNTQPHTGRRACYLRGCRLPECQADNYRYTKQLRLDRERGLRRLRDTGPAVQHLQRLADAGWIQAQIARVSGVTHSHIRAIANGEIRSISPKTTSRILAVPVGPAPADDRFVDATGSTRRIQALIAFGYPAILLAEHLQLAESAVGLISRGDRSQVCATTAETITRAYKWLSRVPGPSNRARILATRKGWHGPFAWDAATIDDPAAQPEVDEPYKPLASSGRDPMRMAELEHLLSLGESEAAIAKQMGSSEDYIHDLATVIRNRKKPADRADMRKAA